MGEQTTRPTDGGDGQADADDIQHAQEDEADRPEEELEQDPERPQGILEHDREALDDGRHVEVQRRLNKVGLKRK